MNVGCITGGNCIFSKSKITHHSKAAKILKS